VPNLPRIRSRRVSPVAGPVEDTPRRIAELHSDGLTWIHLESPTQEEAQELAARFGWHPLDVEDVLSRRQRPKVDVYSGEPDGRNYLFAVLHFPVYDKSVGRLNAGELDVFLGPDYLVTLPAVDLRPVSLLFRRASESEELRHTLFARGSGRLLYEVLDDLYDYCFPILDKIGFKLEQIDEAIGGDEGAKELVTDIHKVKQEIISYRKIIKPQRPTLRQLERAVERFLPEDLELYFDDIVDASERIWDLLDNYKEVVEALEDTNESLISHQQNDILYVLTIFIVVLTPLTFITGFFGMNVHFPGFNTLGAFIASIVLMIAVSIGMIGFFRWKKWL
jgi:magnesium transporter